MEEKIEKLFSFFGKIKNEPFYTSIIAQIIQNYETCPESLKFILYNLKQLIFSSTKQVKLRIKHRLICASIVAKLNNIYVNRIRKIVENDENIDLQNFQLQTEEGEIDYNQEVEANDRWEKLDLFKVIDEEDILLSTEKNGGIDQAGDQSNQNTIFEQYMNMKQATMINIEQLFKDVKNDKANTQIAFQANKSKYHKKIERMKKRKQEYAENITLIISNPFNLLFQICIDNFLNAQWELRHLSTLIMKQLIMYPDFLGFTAKVTLSEKQILERGERFQQIEFQTKDYLKEYIKAPKSKDFLYNKVVTLNLRLLCLDRFADYQSDESNIIVRVKSAETLARCYVNLTNQQQLELLKKIKKIFDREAKIGSVNKKFTWEVKHSFMTFVNFITEYPDHQPNIYKFLHESMIKMLSTEQQIDEIVLAICKCFKKFLGQKFFDQKQIQKVNEQVWKNVKFLDDISVSTVAALELLGALFPYYNLNVCNSLAQIRKFFTSKIPEVRKQFYNLLSLLYQKKFTTKSDEDKKLVESNIVQFLQASVVEYDEQIFSTLKDLSPKIFIHIRQQKKIFNVISFVTDIVLREDYTEKIIEEKFIVFEKFGLDRNDYIYIYELEKSHITIDKYVDKRIWKVAEILAKGFQNNFEGFQELVNGIEKHSKNSDRGKLFILHLMVRLVEQHKDQKLFTAYMQNVKEMMKLQFCKMEDTIINQIKSYSKTIIDNLQNKSPQFSSDLAELIKTGSITKNVDLSTIKQISLLHALLKQHSSKMEITSQVAQLLDTEINLVQNLIEHEKTLFKQIKVLSTCFYVKKEGFSGDTLNTIVAAIREAMEEDKYRFISEYGAETFYELSLNLASKKVSYSKVIGSVLNHISQKYEKKDMKINEDPHGHNLKADYMMAINYYICKIGATSEEWLNSFKSHFITDYQTQQGRDPALFLLSGTIESILKICNHKFIEDLLTHLNPILETEQKQNRKLLFTLLTHSFFYLCDNYTEKSNIYFSWFLQKLKEGKQLFLECLMKMGEESIFRIAGVSSLFVLEIVKLLSQNQSKDLAMQCLSNIVVGVYMNNRALTFSEELTEVSEAGIQFVKNFKDASNFQYKVNVKLNNEIDLRSYQEEGIQWLGFLCKFNLNGALCDDMGLGKTLQIFILIQNQYSKIIENSEDEIKPSLIVVPTTLTEHWAYEYKKYFQKCLCETVVITNKDAKLHHSKGKTKPIIYITSYQVLEKRIDIFEEHNFEFIVLDEGHVIKNPKTNKFQAVKRLNGLHRFILTGTPIQNRLKQLWALFDFLMPGYLYTKEIFKNNYEKLFEVNLTTFKEDELLFNDEQKKILEKLHFKVMPFIMRRMKADVLRELPQKIINDYFCELTPLQEKLYGEFETEKHNLKKGENQENILSSLSKMRKIVNHPNLVGKNGTYADSGKFIALNELFEQLGFRQQQAYIQNKAIIFSRSTSTIELIERLFMKVQFPRLKYTKLTAAVKASQRFMVAQNFNGDNDIKVLLVTTSVGGEGLNLSSANTVIMFDHDYNPTVDMQAIDRAHRIGQKRVLNVYRLITKDTLEQKIMGIQKFKQNLAQAIVNIDNASIRNIEESRLPQLLENLKQFEDKPKHKQKIKHSFYSKMVEQMENDAIEEEDYYKEY